MYGFAANNSPTVSDLWNSTPVCGFPYNRSSLAPAPLAAALIDGGLSQHVVGSGAYVSWSSLVYLEADLYHGVGRDVLNATGNAGSGDLRTGGVAPYWRLALEQGFDRHYVQFGAYGLSADVLSGRGAPGLAGRVTDNALDANYQFTLDPRSVVSSMVSAHVTLIHEVASLRGNIGDGRRTHRLDTFRADASYSIAATVTPTLQYFQTSGRGDASYWATPSGRPGSSGIIAEVAYVPWGKPGSWIAWGNIRLVAQYVSYFRFDGRSQAASGNNAFYVGLWSAAHF